MQFGERQKEGKDKRVEEGMGGRVEEERVGRVEEEEVEEGTRGWKGVEESGRRWKREKKELKEEEGCWRNRELEAEMTELRVCGDSG